MQSLRRMGVKGVRGAMTRGWGGVVSAPQMAPQTMRRFYSEEEKVEIMEEMKKDIKDMKVLLFMKGEPEAPRCGFSGRTVELLAQYAVPYTSYNVLAHEAVREGVKEISGWPTIPQLFVNGEFVGGCDLMMEMHESGDLAELFQNADVRYRNPKTGVVHGATQGADESN